MSLLLRKLTYLQNLLLLVVYILPQEADLTEPLSIGHPENDKGHLIDWYSTYGDPENM